MTVTVRGACPHDCPDTCAWIAEIDGDRAVSLRGDPDHPYTRGVLCSKVDHFLEARVYNPDRLLGALRRVGPKGSGAFEPVSVDEALDQISARLQQIVRDHGGVSVMPYSYHGTQGVVQAKAMHGRFFARLGATRLKRSICAHTANAGVKATNGTTMGVLPEDVVHARVIILWGTNTVVTNLHLWPFVLEARKRGARIIVIDPVVTHTARAADQHIQPRPGTDAALALGMMNVIVAEGLHDADYIAQHTLGFDRLQQRLAEYPVERVAEITGLSAQTIIDLARTYATARPSLIRLLVGMEHHGRGGTTFRTVTCLPAITGAWRDRGGGLAFLTWEAAYAAFQFMQASRPELEDASVRAFQQSQLGRALDPNLDPPIRALFVFSSNPAVSAPHQSRVVAGLGRDDLFTVVHEQFMTETARFADYVLPATTQLEHHDLMFSWGHPYITLNQPAIAPRGDAISISELFRRLAARMGFAEPCFRDSDEEIIEQVLTSDHPLARGIDLERLRRDGWARLAFPDDHRPFAAGEFPTRSGKCELYSEDLKAAGLDPLPGYIPDGDPVDAPDGSRYPLQLLTPRLTLRFLNSSYSHVPRMLEREREPLLEIDPEDAAARGIADRDLVRVFNGRGALELRARVGHAVRPGVVAMPFGWGHAPDRASVNVLTSDGLSDLGGGADFHGTRVEVALAAKSESPVTSPGSRT